MFRTRKSRIRSGFVAVLASLVAITAITPMAFAETGPPRTEAVVEIISDSTTPDDPADGIIRTLDLAAYRLNISQNGSASGSAVVASVTLTNGTFADADPTTPGINPPAVCEAGSAISADRRTLTCNVGVLDQGTSVALDYSVMASGEVADGDQLTGTVSIAGVDPLPLPPITITGTSQVDVSKHHVDTVRGTSVGGTDGYFVRYRIDVRTASADGRGGLPLEQVTFTDNWSNIAATFPGTQLVTNNDPYNAHGQTFPVGVNRTSPVRAQASADPDALYNTAEWIIPDPGTWNAAYSSSSDTTVDITVAGFSNEPIADRSTASTVVTSGLVTLFIPGDSVPIGNTNFTNAITNVAGTPRGGGAPVADYNPSNNSADASLYKVIEAGYRNQWSAWINRDLGMLDSQPTAIEGNASNYWRPALTSNNWSSGGHQRVYPGHAISAEAVSANNAVRITGGITSTLTCIKFAQPVTAGGNATADVLGHLVWGSPEMKELPHGAITIQYGTISGVSAANSCGNSQAAWTTTRPASFNAVRAFANVTAAVPQAQAEGRSIVLTLQVPVDVPASAPEDQVRGFWNTSVNGTIDGGVFTPWTANPVDGNWVGTGTDDRYDIPTNTGDARNGDRVIVAQAVSTFDKRICDSDGSTREVAVGDAVEFCLTATIEGNGPVDDIRIIDETILEAGSPFTIVPGTSTITVNGTSSPAEPATAPEGAVWDLGTVTAPATVQVRFTARSATGSANPGESWANTARITAPGLPDYSTLSTNADPNADQQTVQFRSGRFQLNVAKSTTSPSITYPNTPVNWDVTLTNQGESTIGTVDLIDILPFHGDSTINRVPGSTFSGTVGLVSPVTADGTVSYTTADPATISSNPADPSNQPGGSTTWTTSPPSDLMTVTAVRIVDTNPLHAGATRTITIPMATDGNHGGDTYTNDAGAIVTEGTDGPTLPIRSNDVTVGVQTPGLGITKATTVNDDGNPQGLYPGVENTYTLTYANTGAIAARNAHITDTVRNGLTIVPGSISDGGSYDAGTRTITWDLGDVGPGGGGTRTFAVTVDHPAHPDLLDDTGLVPNTATITSDDDCIPAADLDERCESTVTNPPANPHLWQDKTVDLNQALPGNELTYTLTVGNDGEAPATGGEVPEEPPGPGAFSATKMIPATGVTAFDELPAGVTFVSAATERGTVTDNGDGTLLWTIGTIEAGETLTATITVTIDDGQWNATLTNQVIASHDPGDCIGSCEPPRVEHPCEDDPTWSCATTQTPEPSLRQDKVVDHAEATPGDELTYTLTITNEGDVTATGYGPAIDELPDGLSFVAASHDGVWNDSDRTITWTGLADIAPGDHLELTVTATVDDNQWNSEFINRFEVTPPPTWPPTNVDNACDDEPQKSCAPTVTPGEPQTPTTEQPQDPEPPALTPQGPLPRTGASMAGLVVAGLALIGAGIGLRSRRRTATTGS